MSAELDEGLEALQKHLEDVEDEDYWKLCIGQYPAVANPDDLIVDEQHHHEEDQDFQRFA